MSSTTTAARTAMWLRTTGCPGSVAAMALDGRPRHALPANGRADLHRAVAGVYRQR